MPKLLLVEDDNNLREIYQARLQAEGYDIVAAKDGEEALVVAKSEKPDLVVSDVMMPKISGFEMLDILRNTEGLEHVKVIMLTALGQSDDQARADKLGADRYLVKSQVTLEDIVKTAHDLLQESGVEAAPEAPAAEAAPATDAMPTTEAAVEVAPAPQEAPTPEVAAAPAVEPAPAPAPEVTPITVTEAPVAVEPAPAPVEQPAVAPASPTPEAQSTSEEAASVEANIESFVAGASSEPSAPLPTPEVTPASEAAPAIPEAPANTDQIMAQAVDSLNQATPAATEPATEASTPEASGSVGGVRVIQPTESTAPQKDINDLLALEEAKEAAAAQTQSPAPEQQAPQTPPAPADGPDPNSIAL